MNFDSNLIKTKPGGSRCNRYIRSISSVCIISVKAIENWTEFASSNRSIIIFSATLSALSKETEAEKIILQSSNTNNILRVICFICNIVQIFLMSLQMYVSEGIYSISLLLLKPLSLLMCKCDMGHIIRLASGRIIQQ